ncbi:M56 family metallopeptidase [Anaerotignum sp.]
MNFVYMSISAAFMILAIIGLRKLLINKVPHLVFEFLWILVLVRLYIPYDFATDHNFYNLLYGIRGKLAETDIFNIDFKNYYIDRTFVEFVTMSSFKYLFTLVWIVVGLMVFSYFWHDYISAKKIWKNAVPATATEQVQNLLQKKGLNNKFDVRESKEISMPMAYGVLHPTIILPAGFDTNKTIVFEAVILHEYMHLKYHHPFLQHIIVLILCVNWFNPLIWMIYRYIGRDMEISCDMHVLDQIGSNNRESYALSLLEMASNKGKDMTFYNGFTKHLVRERTVAIMKYKKTSIKAAIFSVLLPVVVFLLFGTSDNYVFGDEIEAGEMEVVIVEAPELPNYREIFVPFSELEPYLVKNDAQTIDELKLNEFKTLIPLEEGLTEELHVNTEVAMYQYSGTLQLVDADLEKENFVSYYSGSLYRK